MKYVQKILLISLFAGTSSCALHAGKQTPQGASITFDLPQQLPPLRVEADKSLITIATAGAGTIAAIGLLRKGLEKIAEDALGDKPEASAEGKQLIGGAAALMIVLIAGLRCYHWYTTSHAAPAA